MKGRGVTLVLLWQEYRAEHSDGYGYSRYCDLYGEWRKTISATMRQTHPAGEKLFVDYAGDTVPGFDQVQGERAAHIFVAALGASNYTYAEARWSEGLADWIGAHVNTLTAIGGVPKAVVCDNLKAGVTKPARYEPGINRTYQDLATYYGFVVLPTRVRKPRDKAKVEVAVQIVERFVLARLRNQRFFSLEELNAAIRECVVELNAKIMRKLGKSRRELLETIERPALKPLPAEPYRYAEWKRARVAPDYHIEIAGHYYSVPSRLIREVVEARITHPSYERLIALGLTGMAKALEEQRRQSDLAALDFEERLGLMIDRETIERENKRLASRLKFAALRQSAVVEDINLKAPRGLDKALFQKLVAGDWIERHQNLLIIGQAGVGKSWLACALGHKACRDDRSVRYHRVSRLFDGLLLARGDGRYGRLLKMLARVQLLILDDWGLAPLTPEQGRDLLEILDDRHGCSSTIVTSQLPVDHWHELIGNPTIADAILDRLVHNAHRLTLKGDSMRKLAAKQSGLDANPTT